MENIKSFLETSTIHGLSYISTTGKYIRLFWIFVVITGFSGAGFLIYQSFQSWEESPVKTTIETLPVEEIALPKVTVCPPKDTYTNLNYDLMMTQNLTINNDTRKELKEYAIELLLENLHETVMSDLNKMQDSQRYYNWYRGYSPFKLPLSPADINAPDIKTQNGGSNTPCYKYAPCYQFKTYATSGSISTPHFGEPFDATKVDANLIWIVEINIPFAYTSNPNITAHVEIEKNSMRSVSSGYDKFIFERIKMPEKIVNRKQNYTPYTIHTRNQGASPFRNDANPSSYNILMSLERKVSIEDVAKMRMDKMPGFKVTWRYTPDGVKPYDPFYICSTGGNDNASPNCTSTNSGVGRRKRSPAANSVDPASGENYVDSAVNIAVSTVGGAGGGLGSAAGGAAGGAAMGAAGATGGGPAVAPAPSPTAGATGGGSAVGGAAIGAAGGSTGGAAGGTGTGSASDDAKYKYTRQFIRDISKSLL